MSTATASAPPPVKKAAAEKKAATKKASTTKPVAKKPVAAKTGSHPSWKDIIKVRDIKHQGLEYQRTKLNS